MSETPQATPDASGVTRTADGTIVDQSQSSGTTPAAGTEQTPTTPQDPNKTKDNTSLLNQDEKTPEGEKKPEAEKPAKVVPETYVDFKLPDGFTFDGEIKTTATAMFKDWGLSQEEAQSGIDFFTKQMQAAQEAPANFYLETRKGWQEEAKTSADLGPKFNEVKSTIGKAIAMLPTDVGTAFKEAMDVTGAGDHPAFIRAFYQLAQKVTEGRPVNGNGPSPNGQSKGPVVAPSTAQAMYPNLPSANG